MTRLRAVLPAVAVLTLLAACTASVTPDEPELPSPFADCTTLTATRSPAWPAAGSASRAPGSGSPASGVPSAAASASSSAAGASSSEAGASPSEAGASSSAAGGPRTASLEGLPDLTLPCFTGGAPVALRALPGPAVINLWASWCEPCRTELPVMQGLADRTQGRLAVLGVNSSDRRAAAVSFATDKGVRFPTLADPDGELAIAVKQTGLPATIFVGPDGAVSVHRAALDVDELIAAVREHTGVTVTR